MERTVAEDAATNKKLVEEMSYDLAPEPDRHQLICTRQVRQADKDAIRKRAP